MSSEYDGAEEEAWSEDDGEPAQNSRTKDERDMIIAKQRQMIKEMQREFTATLDSLRAQLKEYIAQSTEVQNDMVDRIRELKAELAQVRKKPTTTRTSQVVRSSLYTGGPKHPRKLAQADDVRRKH